MSTTTTTTWHDRLKAVIGPNGYNCSMRRSVQTCILFEAKRILLPRLDGLRPFQRRFAFMDQAESLLESLDFLSAKERDAIFYRTMSSGEKLKPDVAWTRAQAIDKELELLSHQIKPFCNTPGRTHDEAVDLLVRDLFRKVAGEDGAHRPVPLHWENAHRHVMMTYRLYYRFDQLDPDFPPPRLQKELSFPLVKPARNKDDGQEPTLVPPSRAHPPLLHMPPPHHQYPVHTHPFAHPYALAQLSQHPPPTAHLTQEETTPSTNDEPHMGIAAISNGEGSSNNNKIAAAEERRRLLAEVRDHLEILKEFDGIISPGDLAERKRQLFLALPSAPPAVKKPRA